MVRYPRWMVPVVGWAALLFCCFPVSGCHKDPAFNDAAVDAAPVDGPTAPDMPQDTATADAPTLDTRAPDTRALDTRPSPDMATNATVITVAGKNQPGYQDGPAHIARFNTIIDIALDAKGDLLISDGHNYVIRKLSNGRVTTVAGRYHVPTSVIPPLQSPVKADKVDLFNAGSLAVINNDIYFGERGTSLRKLDSTGWITTVAGGDTRGQQTGTLAQTQFVGADIVGRVDDTLYVLDSGQKSKGFPRQQLVAVDLKTKTSHVLVSTDKPELLCHHASNVNFNVPLFPLSKLKLSAGLRYFRPPYFTLGSSLCRLDSNNRVVLLSACSSGYSNGPPFKKIRFGGLGDLLEIPGKKLLYMTDETMIRWVAPTTGDSGTAAGARGKPGFQDGPAKSARMASVWTMAYDAKKKILYFAERHYIRALVGAF